MTKKNCPGCIGRGTGRTCLMCNLPIPSHLRRAADAPTEIDLVSCVGCRCGWPHIH